MVTRAVLILLCLSLAAGAQSKTTGHPGAGPKKARQPRRLQKRSHGHHSHHHRRHEVHAFSRQSSQGRRQVYRAGQRHQALEEPGYRQTMHGKPLYDGVIFHRTIPDFMIPAGDPTGTGAAIRALRSRMTHPDLLFDQPGRWPWPNRAAACHQQFPVLHYGKRASLPQSMSGCRRMPAAQAGQGHRLHHFWPVR